MKANQSSPPWPVAILAALLLSGACSPDGMEPLPPAADRARDATRLEEQRRQMVERQLRARGIRDEAVLRAMERVPRHLFVPEERRGAAYEDHPVPIGHGQTISQPYIVAFMTEALEMAKDHRVLEIGTGSGYQAAVLAELAREVYTIEIVPELAHTARATIVGLGYENVHVLAGDGYRGWPEHAPFDRIMVTAAPDHVPHALVEQLATPGRMIVPVGTFTQELVIVTKTTEGVTEERTLPVRFVPMTGKPVM
jgi:protein-L-isoaspartate(D-aspartate) O-methyltransferase